MFTTLTGKEVFGSTEHHELPCRNPLRGANGNKFATFEAHFPKSVLTRTAKLPIMVDVNSANDGKYLHELPIREGGIADGPGTSQGRSAETGSPERR